MVANRLRANLEQKPVSEASKLPVASALGHLFQSPAYQNALMPFQSNPLQPNPLQAQILQAQQAALQQASQVRAAQAAAQAAQQAVATQSNNSDGNLYQPAVKRRRRGYGSEVRNAMIDYPSNNTIYLFMSLLSPIVPTVDQNGWIQFYEPTR